MFPRLTEMLVHDRSTGQWFGSEDGGACVLKDTDWMIQNANVGFVYGLERVQWTDAETI